VKIQVDAGRRVLTYEITEAVEVGDTVMIPPPFWAPSDPPREGTVVALGSDYGGPTVRAWLPSRGKQ
jgi:hypothetical protein